MLDEDTKKFISEEVSKVCRAFGITGTAPECGSNQPGALEVISDALCQGNWSDGVAVGSGLHEIASAITDLANAVEKIADELERHRK
jgi:hypothetical protein